MNLVSDLYDFWRGGKKVDFENFLELLPDRTFSRGVKGPAKKNKMLVLEEL